MHLSISNTNIIVVTPIGNTVVKAGEKMKIQWYKSQYLMAILIYIQQLGLIRIQKRLKISI